MNNHTPAALWQALHTAYEERNPEEARRLLSNGTIPPDCSHFQRCDDLDYLHWLLENKLVAAPVNSTGESWPGTQEKQLQCDALPEAERPACILEGEWEKRPSI